MAKANLGERQIWEKNKHGQKAETRGKKMQVKGVAIEDAG